MRDAATDARRGGVSPEEQRRRAEERLTLLNGALDVYRKAGATLHPIELPATLTRYSSAISFVLSTEAAAAFDDLTRSPGIKDESLNTWPNTFRTHRFVPAVEYIRAQRIRTLLMREMDKLMSEYDVFLSSTNSATLGPDQPDRPSGRRGPGRLRRQRAADADGDRPSLRRGHDAPRRARPRAGDEVE